MFKLSEIIYLLSSIIVSGSSVNLTQGTEEVACFSQLPRSETKTCPALLTVRILKV